MRKWETANWSPIERLVVLESESGTLELTGEQESRILIVMTSDGYLEVLPWSRRTGHTVRCVSNYEMLTIAYSSELGIIATGYGNGDIIIQTVRSILDSEPIGYTRVHRNFSPISSLHFAGSDLFSCTKVGLPCRFGVEEPSGEDGKRRVWVKEEYIGMQMAGVHCWSVTEDGVWCAAREGGVMKW